MRTIALFILLCFTVGCEGNRYGKGHVYESDTNIVLDSVAYRRVDDQTVFFTDSTGYYYIEGPFGGCISECPDFKAEFSKPGYQTLILENPNGRIFLKKQ